MDGEEVPGKEVFATVGTTKFEALIRALDDPEVADVLAARGYTSLVMQVGAGLYVPCRLVPPGTSSATLPSGLRVAWFDFAPSLAAHMRQAALVISHAGSGSLLEALALHKPLVAVPNAILMANHQAELANHLAQLGHIMTATPETLADTLRCMDLGALMPYTPGDAGGIVREIDDLMGFADE